MGRTLQPPGVVRPTRAAWALAGLLPLSCGSRTDDPDEGPPCLSTELRPRTSGTISDAVDLLVVMDGSLQTADEQQAVAESFPRLLERIVGPSELVGARRTFVSDLHVGVITMDVGTGGHPVSGCPHPTDGDDGVLVTESHPLPVGCADQYPPYLSWAEGDDLARFSEDFSCVSGLGEEGCRFRQPLEALRRALLVHRDDANEGFLRDNSLLVVLFVTTADDCSIRRDDPSAGELFDADADLGPLGVRCAELADSHLQPVESFVDEIVALRAHDPGRLVAGAIVGVPPGSSCETDAGDLAGYDCLLSEPAMQKVVDESGQRLVPSCGDPTTDPAFPPRRLVSFLRGVSAAGGATLVRSSCTPSYDEALDAFAAAVETRIIPADCLSRPLPLDDVGGTPCILDEQTIDSAPCPPGRIDLGEGDRGRRCRICQEGDGDLRTVDVDGMPLDACRGSTEAGDFWRYVEGDGCRTGHIEFQGEAVPRPGSVVSFTCLVSDC